MMNTINNKLNEEDILSYIVEPVLFWKIFVYIASILMLMVAIGLPLVILIKSDLTNIQVGVFEIVLGSFILFLYIDLLFMICHIAKVPLKIVVQGKNAIFIGIFGLKYNVPMETIWQIQRTRNGYYIYLNKKKRTIMFFGNISNLDRFIENIKVYNSGFIYRPTLI